MDKMWSAALCTLGVAKPILGCSCLNVRPPATILGTVRRLQLFFSYNHPLFIHLISHSSPTNLHISLSISQESRGKRPLKVWDNLRNLRKGLVVSSFEELLVRGKDKLGLPASESVRVVLECDGTQIEDGEYFRTLANNTVLLLLRQGERWYPSGVDVIKAGKCVQGHLIYII